jgi:predicted anti-sigma-YlaC factor YlaD
MIDKLANQSAHGASELTMNAETGQLCARARFWASLRLDGELSELESALLDAHLASCAACRGVATGFASSTAVLRAEQPAAPAPVRIEVARPSRRPFVAVVAAAVVVLAALVGGLLSGGGATRSATTPHAVAVVASVETPDQLRRLRRTTLLNERKLPRDLAAEPV